MGSIAETSVLQGYAATFEILTLKQMFEERSVLFSSEKLALIFLDENGQERKTSYKNLNREANKIASAFLNIIRLNQLQANNEGDWIVAVCMKPSDRLVTLLLAIWKCGAAYLPFDVSCPSNRFNKILEEARPVLIISDDVLDVTEELSLLLKFSELEKAATKFDNEKIATNSMLGLDDPSNLALVLYTSGSTGAPKGVRITHAAVQNRLAWQWRQLPYTKTEVYGIFKTALTFVDSICEIWGPLLNGMTLVIAQHEIAKNPKQFIDLLEEFKIERLVLVPTLLQTLLMFLQNNEKKLLGSLKIWVCSGEALSLQLAKDFFEYFSEEHHALYNFYGSTEMTADVTFFKCESKKQLENLDRLPLGRPIDNTKIFLLGSNLEPVNNGEIGEILVSGRNLFDGYVNGRDPERLIENPFTIDPFHSKLFRTGDFGSLLDGNLYYEGRFDSQIKIRGHRVDLTEIEESLESLSFVEKGKVLCYHAGESDQALLAFCVINFPKTEIEIENELKSKLMSYMLPQVIVVDSFPLLVNGKVDRQLLLKIYEKRQTEVEMNFDGIDEENLEKAKTLFETISSSIGQSLRSEIKKSSNFYELGGNSLNSISVISELRSKNFFISIMDFISAETLGDVIEKMKKSEEKNSSVLCNFNLLSFPLSEENREEAVNITAECFLNRGDLEQFFKMQHEDYVNFLEAGWDFYLSENLSFVVKDSSRRIVGVSVNFDMRNDPKIQSYSHLAVIDALFAFLDGPIRSKLLTGNDNRVFYAFLMATIPELNAKQNIDLMLFMEREVLEVAKRNFFDSIMTWNISSVAQEIGANVFDYKTLLEYQVNQYVSADGLKPFVAAPDSMKVVAHWKEI